MSTGIYMQAASVSAPRATNDDREGGRTHALSDPADNQASLRDYSTEPAAPVSAPPSGLVPGLKGVSPRRLVTTRNSLSACSLRLPAKTKPRIVLLQGPVGPFFSRLQESLERAGFDAWYICFNAGDRLFSRSRKRIGFARCEHAFWKPGSPNTMLVAPPGKGRRRRGRGSSSGAGGG